MSGLTSPSLSVNDGAMTDHAVKVPRFRQTRLRVLAGSVIGVGCLFVAQGLAPEHNSLFAAPSGAAGWFAMIFGIAGVWLVPGLWLSALVMRVGAGPAGWLGTRIATTLAWYALVGPAIHKAVQGSWVTTTGILTVTTTATVATSVGLALGLLRRPTSLGMRILVAAVVGGVCAQGVIWASSVKWSDDRAYSHIRLDLLIVLGCALLVAIGAVSRPKLPPVPSARDIRTPLIALTVIAITAAALLAIGAKWSPAQQMPSAYSAEQIPAPAGADLAFALTAIGPDGFEFVRKVDFAVTDEAGRPVAVESRLVPLGDTAERANLLITLPQGSQPELCGKERMDFAFKTGAPVKLTMRDQSSGLLVQAVLPVRWCIG